MERLVGLSWLFMCDMHMDDYEIEDDMKIICSREQRIRQGVASASMAVSVDHVLDIVW